MPTIRISDTETDQDTIMGIVEVKVAPRTEKTTEERKHYAENMTELINGTTFQTIGKTNVVAMTAASHCLNPPSRIEDQEEKSKAWKVEDLPINPGGLLQW